MALLFYYRRIATINLLLLLLLICHNHLCVYLLCVCVCVIFLLKGTKLSSDLRYILYRVTTRSTYFNKKILYNFSAIGILLYKLLGNQQFTWDKTHNLYVTRCW